ncbi:MAG: SCP-2 sterol transfer family protein [Myxococcales bacterium]|nr:SCP-2 sterol transfer family protein [Myxococcales bacterium]|tara:strand:+ start:391 stop:729 length:339 start_codon:yes stop_codon:yes gene_type:complete
MMTSQTNAREFFERQLVQRITPEWLASVEGSVFQFHITGEAGGSWIVDMRKTSEWVSEGEDEAADCTIGLSEDDLVLIVDGQLNPNMAYMLGKLRITGNIGLSLKIPPLLAG